MLCQWSRMSPCAFDLSQCLPGHGRVFLPHFHAGSRWFEPLTTEKLACEYRDRIEYEGMHVQELERAGS